MNDSEIAKLNFSGWPLPDEYLIELGRIVALWSSLEKLLIVLIGKLAGYNNLEDVRPFALLNHSSFPQKLDILGTLCENLVSDHSQLSNYKAVIGSLRSAQTLRNKFAHHVIDFDEQSNKAHIGVLSARGTLKIVVDQIDISNMRKASIAISEASNELYKLVLNKDHGPAWKRKASRG